MRLLTLKNGTPEDYTLSQFRKDHPTISFPATFPAELLSGYGVHPYTMETMPDYDERYQTVSEGDFYQLGAEWRRRWVVTDFVPEEISKVQLIRALRLTELPSGSNAWETAKLILSAAGEELNEDWDAITRVPRNDATFLSLAEQIRVSEGMTTQAMSDLLDQVFKTGVTR